VTLDELLDRAASQCIDERESYLAIFTIGINGYVCRNEGSIREKYALFHGTFRECQIWIERRGIAVALDYILSHKSEVAELEDLSADELLRRIIPPAS
jgi:hypothetical protein